MAIRHQKMPSNFAFRWRDFCFNWIFSTWFWQMNVLDILNGNYIAPMFLNYCNFETTLKIIRIHYPECYFWPVRYCCMKTIGVCHNMFTSYNSTCSYFILVYTRDVFQKSLFESLWRSLASVCRMCWSLLMYRCYINLFHLICKRAKQIINCTWKSFLFSWMFSFLTTHANQVAFKILINIAEKKVISIVPNKDNVNSCI